MRFSRFDSMKILTHWPRLLDIRANGVALPVEMVIYPTNNCCLECNFCIMREERVNGGSLSDDLLMSLPQQAMMMSIGMMYFSGGGEPTLHPKLVDCAKESHRLGMQTSLNTNGVISIDYSPFNYVRFSVDACTPETYFKVKGKDYFDRVVANIRRAISFCGNVTEFGISMVVTKENIIDMRRFPEWAMSTFRPTFIHIRPAAGVVWNERERGMFFKLNEMYAGDDYVRISLEKSEDFRMKQFSKCRSSSLRCVVNADGRLSVCQDNFIKFGDLYTQNLDEIWESPEHLEAIAKIKINECPRCVDAAYNEIIENCVMKDELRRWLI